MSFLFFSLKYPIRELSTGRVRATLQSDRDVAPHTLSIVKDESASPPSPPTATQKSAFRPSYPEGTLSNAYPQGTLESSRPFPEVRNPPALKVCKQGRPLCLREAPFLRKPPPSYKEIPEVKPCTTSTKFPIQPRSLHVD